MQGDLALNARMLGNNAGGQRFQHPGRPDGDQATGRSLFIGLMGTPYQSDLTTSCFRLTEEALRQGNQVVVWTCGYGTMLTQSTLVRPLDVLAQDENANEQHPSTAELVRALFRAYPTQLRWYVCLYCMEERGAVAQISEVEIKIPFSFNTYLTVADQGLVLGVKS
jgi:sulfur relay (sulfurtransferase) complex TusBCD TusD component (DsrE family)